MNGRDRLLCVLRGGIPDRLPWSPLINSYFLDSLPADLYREDPIDFLRDIRADIGDRWVVSYQGFGIEDPVVMANGGIEFKIAENGGKKTVQYKTPFGNLLKVFTKRSATGSTWFIIKHLVEDIDDLKAYRTIWESCDPEPDYESTRQRIEKIGSDGIAMVTVPATPLLQLIMYDLGLEKTNYFLQDYAIEMKALLDIMAEKSLKACQVAVDSPAEVGIIPENSGTMLVTPRQFQEYCAPLMQEYAKIYKEHNKILLLHACGHMNGLLNQVAGTGLSGIESLTPPPTGNVDLDHGRESLQGMTIFGGLDPVFFLKASPSEVKDEIKRIVDVVYPGDHFVLMPSDSTPYGVPIANFEAVSNTIQELAG